MKTTFKVLIASAAFIMSCSSSFAHVWQVGWESTASGGLDLYGVSYHTSLHVNNDDFFTNPAGFVLNGTNFSFDLGSTVDLEDITGGAGVVGTVSTIWNNLGLDGSVDAQAGSNNGGFYNGSTAVYGKYASTSLTSGQLALIGITGGANSVTLTTFANNVHWDGLPFDSATVPIDIQITSVPEPATLALFGLTFIGLVFSRRQKKS